MYEANKKWYQKGIVGAILKPGKQQQYLVQRGLNIDSLSDLNSIVNKRAEELAAESKTEVTQEIKKKYYCPYFLSTYNQISNFSDSNNRESISNHNVTYLIISNPVFINYLDDFISWKKQKGFNVLLANTLDIGSSTENIKSHVEDLYFNPPNNLSPPSFVLFVGDVAQVPTFNGTTGSHPTDLYYTEMTNDMIPDIYRGRFSAENPNQLEAQLYKTIEYEKYMMPDPSYLQNVLLVSGVDSYYAATHGNGQINYGNEYYFNSTNDN